MAVAAFKSSSRRGNLTTTTTHSAGRESSDKENPPKKAPIRRSRSVSAFPRRTNSEIPSTSDDFLNKRDNPLFWSGGSGSLIESPTTNTNANADTVAVSHGGVDNRRGRSVARTAGVGSNKGPGSGKETARSLSRVYTGRRDRSVSRQHFATSESEAENDRGLSEDFKIRSDRNVVSSNAKKGGLVRGGSDIWSGQSEAEPSDGFATTLSCWQTPTNERVSVASSLSEAEDKIIKPVCEQMKSVQGDNVECDSSGGGIHETVRAEVRRAISEIQNDLEIAIRRNNATDISTTNVVDITPDLVNPGAVELVLNYRREYAKKLEQSLERARKLQADLAVEEHRGHELSRILKEVLPDPKTPSVQKSRPGRKSSIERRKMSKRLEEEALAYFDECISLSTFDSSDFSSPEDPPLDLATPVGNGISLPQDSYMQGQMMNGHDVPGLTAGTSSSKEPNLDLASPNSVIAERSWKFQFSVAGKTAETVELQQDIRKYIRNFEKHDFDSKIARSNRYDVDEYNLQASKESLLCDRVKLKNRIESGGFLLCGGGIKISCSPFASIT
ncbi:uncharacterized protein LOC122291725 isoform X1 [Carya illinoinensis]|uniref:Uncharacterized protein n=1 Tax=Carya illinoinensis TaxID=32201 RepID=A0A8T1NG73_CARIL|nr:uncharacterized protein LOC122291725 isoform X1 [Carya illinoinensis]KAG6630826.1 hypothetical protein CIPAW_13G047300 [Carya illinoinensis]KAG6680532.1 hypothetical protein I3842_13G047300 [Carya illinoinensis]